MYRTNDMYLAAFLVARGIKLDSHVRINGKTTFQLSEKDGIDDTIREYYSDAGQVSALRLFNALKNLKNLLYLNVDQNGKSISHNYGAAK